MKNTFYKGENILVKFTPVDKTKTPIPWASITALTVVIIDQANKSQSFSKAGGSITEASGVLSLEITAAMTAAFKAGKLTARFTYTVTDAAYASGSYVDIIDEGITDVFINLQ
jgi:hypothetical protein